MLKPFMFAACGLLLASAAIAAPPPAALPPHKVVSAVTGDFNGDGSMDRAVLVDDADDDSTADLIVYFNQDNVFTIGGFAKGIAFNGRMAGNMPELRIGKTGGLQVHSENMAIGRDHWEQTLSLAWRNRQIMVSGITAMHYDTLDPDGGGSCDVNLLTGKGTASLLVKGKSRKQPVSVAAGGVPLAQWNDDKMPKACQ